VLDCRISPTLAERIVTYGAALVVALSFAARFPLLEARGFNPDEFEHLHAAWCTARGQLPYRDFFEHHTPALYFAAAPLLRRYDLDGEVTGALAAVFAARRAMAAFSAVILIATVILGRRWRGRASGWAAAAFLASSGIFLGKTLEFRPDVPAVALWMVSLVAVAGSSAAVGGVLAGTAVLFTQKLLFGWLGPAAALARSTRVLRFVAGALPPCALAAAWFARQGALAPFIEDNFLLNARWVRRAPWALPVELLTDQPLLMALAAVGIVRACRPAEWRRDPLGRLLLLTLAGGAAGLLALPVVHRQYALVLLPILALFAAAALTDLLPKLVRPRFAAEAAAAAVVLALALVTSARLREGFGRGNTGDLENIRYVLRNVAPAETVLDGFTGQALFRPHAFFYFFLHGEVRATLGPEPRAQLLDGLRGFRIAPKLVLLDSDLREFSPAAARFIEENYAPLGHDPIWGRLFDNGRGTWRDEAPRRLAGPLGDPLSEPHVFVGEGWQRAQAEGDRSFRRSRGRRSQLLVPVKSAGALRAIVVARAETPPPVRLELRVNGVSAGCRDVAAGWHEYAFDTTADWKASLNDLTLRYRGGAADAPDPGIAVETLRLEPQASSEATTGNSSCADTALPTAVQWKSRVQ
jgi:hypothetical protein